jgi:hypothetical protein
VSDKAGDPLRKFIKAKEKAQGKDKPFKCTACGYSMNVGQGPCNNCGRDFLGRDGQVPTGTDRDPRAALRSDVSDGFADFTP